MKSEYKSSKSVGKNQTVPISVEDPRLAWNKIGQTKARQGAEIDIVGLDGKSLIVGGASLTNSNNGGKKAVDGANGKGFVSDVVLPPMDGQPPKTYPGGSGPFIIVPTNPANVTASWYGEDLVVNFNWTYTDQSNTTVTQFILEVTADGITRRTPLNTFVPNKTSSSQTVTLTKSLNRLTFGLFRTNITSICVLVADPLNNISQTICAGIVPTYVLDLPVPVITLTAISNGYSVAYTTPTQSSFDALDIWEIEDSGTTAPVITYAIDGTTPTNYIRSYFSNLNPANVITQNYNKRWVIARFSSSGGAATAFCTAQVVTPTSPVSVDNTPPDEVTQVTALWSGDNVVINYKLPAQIDSRASRVQIELTAPNSLVGFFYRFPDGSGRDQTTTITKKDLFDQFGEHYSSFTGILRSIDSADNRTSGVSFSVPLRINPLSGITPTFTLTPLTNGYSVFATNYATTIGISYMEVYAKHTPWVGDPINDNDIVYSGANPAVVIDTDYSTVYVKIHYYDDFGNVSLYSLEDTVVPMGPGDITSFETPISFGTNGVIYAGGDYASGKRTLFKSSGIFAYDAVNTSPSTQIVSDASAGTPTFITTQAQIAGWTIDSTKIQKLVAGKYTGMESGSTYSFYAGSSTSGGDANAKFLVTPSGEVTAREITIIGNGGTGPLISAGGLFTVNNDGSFTATSADITGKITASSGEFTGNVKLNGGSLYALGTGGTVSTGIRTIFNSSGVAAYNAAGGYAMMLTAPLADGSVFATTAANIGGWEVDSSKIQKTSISGKGNIILDSVNGYIAVSNSAISSSLAGINSPGNNLTHSAFWAGGTDPNATSNPFRVTIGGSLYATQAEITGTISSIGSLGRMTMDGTHGYMSLQTGGTGPSAYIVPRNNNLYITSPSMTAPWSTGKEIASSGPVNGPYFSAGSSFKDYWNNVVQGVGIYTGEWDYFTSGTSKPFITTTTTGIQLSVSPALGLLLDAGTAATGDKLTPAIPNGTPSMLFYTAKRTTIGSNGAPVYSPNTEYGAWASFTNNTIKLVGTSSIYQKIDPSGIEIRVAENTGAYWTPGSVLIKATSAVYQEFNSSGIQINAGANTFITVATNSVITLQASPFVVVGSGVGAGGAFPTDGASAYSGPSKITMDPTYGVVISGIQVQRDIDMTVYTGGYYRNTPPLGPYPRQRMLVEDPVTGQVLLGMAVYYEPGTGQPTSNTGYIGDLLVQY